MNPELTLTALIQEKAIELGADLIGIAPVSRYRHAPLLLSPQGHWSESRHIIVIACHHTDGAIEMGGRPTPHDIGPYVVQGSLNTRNEYIVWHLARLIEDAGYRALPMPVTNVWRFRPYGGVARPFVPDISNIHAAAAAGLGEIGYSGLLLTPEFGPRQRFCTLITDAPLVATPLYEGPSLCDECRMCAKHCMSEAFDKEVDGECVVQIEDKVMRYPNKSMWRCAWGEHFGLDLSLPKPDVITEQVIVEQLAVHGRRGGEMGSCLRHCLPPHLRHHDPDYTDTVRRRLRTGAAGKAIDRPATWEAYSIAFGWGADMVGIADTGSCSSVRIDLKARLTDAERFLVFSLHWPEGCSHAASSSQPSLPVAAALDDTRQFIEMDIARAMERRGYAAIPCTGVSADEATRAVRVRKAEMELVEANPFGERTIVGTVITSAPLTTGLTPSPKRVAKDLWDCLESCAGQRLVRSESPSHPLWNLLRGDVQLLGFSNTGRLITLAEQLERLLDLNAMSVNFIDGGDIHGPVQPKPAHKSQPLIKRPDDVLQGAQSVIVIGCSLPSITIESATEPPADAVGPYAFAVYQCRRELRYAAMSVALALEAGGYRAAVMDDMLGTAGEMANPRGRQPDALSSRFEAVATGLGMMLHTGTVWAPPHGNRARFISIITDAPFSSTPLFAEESPCTHCDKPCVRACPTAALRCDTQIVRVDGTPLTFGALDWLRCEWAKKYALVGVEGPRWMGSLTDTQPPDTPITEADIADGYAQLDPVQKHWMCIVEPCLRACHLHTHILPHASAVSSAG